MGVLCSCEPEWSRLPTLDWCLGVLPIPSILRMCHSEGRFLENFSLHKGPLLTFCLTKGLLFGPKSVSQKGPFQIKIEVSSLKTHLKNFLKSTGSCILRLFTLHFLKFALQKGAIFDTHTPYQKVASEIPKWNTCIPKLWEKRTMYIY